MSLSFRTIAAFSREMTKIALEARNAQRRAAYLFSPRASSERWRTVPRNSASEAYVRAIESNPKADDKLKRHVRSLFLLSKGRTVSKVRSSSKPGKSYEIRDIGNGQYGCTCPDWRYRGSITPGYACRHIKAFKRSKTKTASFVLATLRMLQQRQNRVSANVTEKEQYQKDTGSPFSSMLTQEEEPMDYSPVNPVPDEPDVILGH